MVVLCFFVLFVAVTLPLVSVVVIDVAILALSFRIVHPALVYAVGRHSVSSVSVVAMVAHSLCEMLLMKVRAFRNYARLSPASYCDHGQFSFFFFSEHRFARGVVDFRHGFVAYIITVALNFFAG